MKKEDVLGAWQIKSVETFDLVDGKPQRVTMTRDDLLNHEDKDYRFIGVSDYIFKEDGSFETLMPLPEGISIDDLDEDEKACIKDGLYLIDSKQWIEKDGVIYIDSEQHREILGEVLSSLDSIEMNEDGSITLKSTFPMTFERKR